MQQVGILGLGLIGTSLGLALKQTSNPPRVVGFDLNADHLRGAVQAGAIDHACSTPADVCRGSDVLILATPVRATLRLLPEIAPHVEPQTLVTDTGGTKADVVRLAEGVLGPQSSFVGGHPLAGRLTAGVEHASGSLYRGARYCLTPTSSAAPWAVDAAVQLVESVGGQPYFLDPDEHDALLAAVSHLPYFTAAALVNTVTSQSAWPEMAAMAAGGFRAVSAPVEVDPQVCADIAATNRQHVARQLDGLIERLAAIRQMVGSGDDSLLAELSHARSTHRAWLASRGEGPPPGPPTEPPPRRSRWTNWFRRR